MYRMSSKETEVGIFASHIIKPPYKIFHISSNPCCLACVAGHDHLARMLRLVRENKGKTAPLERPAGAAWKIGDVNDTIYSGKKDEVNGWGKFYLPDEVKMQVLGVVERISCPCEQLVLMTCENEKVYAYDGEELHEVASSLEELSNEGMEYPSSISYYRGEAFKHMVRRLKLQGTSRALIIDHL